MRWFRLCAMALALVATDSCSFVLSTNKTQCSTTADCVAHGFTGYVCGSLGVCVAQGGCSTNADCVNANMGAPFYCRKDNRTCIQLQTSDGRCVPLAEPDIILDDNTVWFGVETSASIPPLHNFALAADFARKEWNTVSLGLPPVGPGGKPRKLALEFCDDYPPANKADEVAPFWIQMGIPVIIGITSSQQTLDVAQQFTNPNGIMVMGITASSPLVSGIQPHDLIWRVRPSDAGFGLLQAAYVPAYLEPEVRSQLSLPSTTPIKVAEISNAGASPAAIAGVVDANLTFNGGKTEMQNGSNYLGVQFLDPADPNNANTAMASMLNAVAQVVAFQPHIIIGIGLGEFPTGILQPIEQMWTAPYKPLWIIDDVPFSQASLPTVVGTNADLRHRLRGAEYDLHNPRHDAFLSAFNMSTPPPVGATEEGDAPGFSYDAFYVVAYAAAALGSKPITGANLAMSLTQLNAATTIVDVGDTNLGPALASLASGQLFHVRGVTGDLNFNQTHDVAVNYETSCLTVDTSGNASVPQGSGLSYNPTTNMFSGMETSMNCP